MAKLCFKQLLEQFNLTALVAHYVYIIDIYINIVCLCVLNVHMRIQHQYIYKFVEHIVDLNLVTVKRIVIHTVRYTRIS